jgi:hypothetical protein
VITGKNNKSTVIRDFQQKKEEQRVTEIEKGNTG